MGYNLPEGNNSYLDDCNMICQHCDRKDDVDNGEYHNHMWYCDECFKELFKVCPKCNVSVISVDEEMCEDCLAEKTYDESAEGMFEKLDYTLDAKAEDCMSYSNKNNQLFFYEFNKTYSFRRLEDDMSEWVSVSLHKAITQQMKELGWL